MEIYNLLDNKFENILSGVCLTTLRDNNKSIIKKYDSISENDFIDIKDDFFIYIQNFLFLKGYHNISVTENVVHARKDDIDYDFLVDFDWSLDHNQMKIKFFDKGSNSGISNFDGKYFFLVSINKNLLYLINCEKLKKQVKEDKQQFRILTEQVDLFKSKFIEFDLNSIGQKIKVFSLK
jgi:hypothetical protein